MLICGVATGLIVYVCAAYVNKKEKIKVNPLIQQINGLIAASILAVYLFLSFMTMAWYITWLLWVVYGLAKKIVKLIFMLKGEYYEK